MGECKNCIHFKMCNDAPYTYGKDTDCRYFDNKWTFDKLTPCHVGDTVYFISRGQITEWVIYEIVIYIAKNNIELRCESATDPCDGFDINYNFYIGYKLFLNREEAEENLK